jgi:hypothetical protein
MSKKISSGLTAVAFAAALTLAGTAEAGPLVAGTTGSEAPSWSMAWDWLTEVWGDLTGLRSDSQSTVTTSGESTGAGSTTDAGCGIDPNGSPCGGA